MKVQSVNNYVTTIRNSQTAQNNQPAKNNQPSFGLVVFQMKATEKMSPNLKATIKAVFKVMRPELEKAGKSRDFVVRTFEAQNLKESGGFMILSHDNAYRSFGESYFWMHCERGIPDFRKFKDIQEKVVRYAKYLASKGANQRTFASLEAEGLMQPSHWRGDIPLEEAKGMPVIELV